MISPEEIAQIAQLTSRKEAEQMLLKQHKGKIRFSVIGAQQLARIKHAQKFPVLSQNPAVYFPLPTALEQSSSEQTAFIKSQLIPEGNRGIDGTGGFGVDALYMSSRFKNYNVCEIQEDLVEIQRYNASLLGKNALTISQSSLEDFLPHQPYVDLLYIDPDRRIQNKRSWSLQDSEPDILKHHAAYLNRAKWVMYKLSPMLDITYLLENFSHLHSLHILGVQGECKELVLISSLQNSPEASPLLWMHNMKNNCWYKKRFTSLLESAFPINEHGNFLFIQDAVANKAVYDWEDAKQLIPMASGVYTSNTIVEDTLPWGRWFRVLEQSAYHKKTLKTWTKQRLDVLCIGTPFSTDQFRKTWNISPGNNTQFLILISQENKTTCYLCERLSL